MAKSADAFRTISEVAEWLDTPAHVLRFWESKFSQVKPVKRAGGRRYYRPADMLLLGGIKKLLHNDGMTIKGVQKLLREQGIKHVSAHSQALDDVAAAEASEIALDVQPDPSDSPLGKVVNFQRENNAGAPAEPTATPAPDTPDATQPPASDAHPSAVDAVDEPEASAPPPPQQDAAESTAPPPADAPEPEAAPAAEAPALPSFMHRRAEEAPATETPAPDAAAPSAQTAEPEPKPKKIDVPDDPADDIAAEPGALSQLAGLNGPLSPELIDRLTPLIERLRQTRDA